MKKTLTVMTLLAGAASVYSQGTVGINAYNAAAGVAVQVFVPQTTGNTVSVSYGGYTVMEKQGNTANSYLTSPGTTVYSPATTLGTGYDVQAYASAGTSATTYTQLAAVGTVVTTWNTGPTGAAGTAAGTWKTAQAVAIPGATNTATMAIAAWQATGGDGAATTLAEAQADGYAWGFSAIATTTVATGVEFSPALPLAITDFSIAAAPEPSTIALGVMGASAFLFRRKK